MRDLLERAGIRMPAPDQEHSADYMEHGSPQHAAMIGLLIVEDVDAAKVDGYTVYVSPRTGTAYRLEDEIAALRFYPGVDPVEARRTVLRQKVNGLESGKPQVPKDAPPMWQPTGYA